MNKTAKVLVTIGVAFLFIIIFGVTVGATKPTDVTTGPMTYEQLQKINNGQFDKVNPEFEKYMDELERSWAPRSLGDLSTHIPQAVESPLSRTDTPWGESSFDENTANANEFEHLGDIRAKNVGRTLGIILGLIAFCAIIIGAIIE